MRWIPLSRIGLSLEQLQMAWGLKNPKNGTKAVEPTYLKICKAMILFPEPHVRELNYWMPIARRELIESGVLSPASQTRASLQDPIGCAHRAIT